MCAKATPAWVLVLSPTCYQCCKALMSTVERMIGSVNFEMLCIGVLYLLVQLAIAITYILMGKSENTLL